MLSKRTYEVAIIGGGLAGLACAIELGKAGRSVILFEKEKYPFHKVCGEYVSLESWNFLEGHGLPLREWRLPLIDTLFLTAPSGRSFTTRLPLGGFGISRYMLDHSLAQVARKYGAEIAEQTKVDAVAFDGEVFTIHFGSQSIKARACCASYGKRSNLDIKWDRGFLQTQDKKLDNYIGVKYHIRTNWAPNTIGLHNFENGYCGISKIEDEQYCLCYMTKAESLKKNGNSIQQLQEKILYHNPHLKKIFTESHVVDGFPLTISQINFSKKTQVEGHVLMLGDAAGMITPLCGNGMSIALHTGKIAAVLTGRFIKNELSRDELELAYAAQWHQHFAKRLRTGRFLQGFFGSSRLSNLFVSAFNNFPFLAGPVVKMTHGKPF